MFGTLIFGFLGDRIGRIKALILANWCGFLGDFSTIFTDNLITFSITRFVSGLAVDTNSYLMFILGELRSFTFVPTFELKLWCYSSWICFSVIAKHWLKYQYGSFLLSRHDMLFLVSRLCWPLENIPSVLFSSTTRGHSVLLSGTGECAVAGHSERYRWGDIPAAACGQDKST